MKRYTTAQGVLLLLCLSLAIPCLYAASDPEYGVDVPGRLIYVSVASGSDAGPGAKTSPFRTISQASAVAMPGDAVLVDNGIYRERVAPPRGGVSGMPIIYKARPGLKVVITGANRWSPAWKPLRVGSPVLWAVPDSAMFTDDCYWSSANPFEVAFARTPGVRNGRPESLRGVASADPTLVYTLGQVFIDGERLEQMGTLAELELSAAGWWYEAATGRVYVRFAAGIDPAAHVVEITTRRRVFAPHLRGLGYIHVLGFVIERCGNQFPARFWESRDTVQAGALGTRAGHHWLIRGNVVRNANSIGIDIGGEGEYDGERLNQPRPQSSVICDNVIENNWVMNNGVSGIAGCHAKRMIVRGNVVTGNNALGFEGLERYEQAGIKLHTANDARVEGNLIKDNLTYGIYLDSGGSYVGVRLSRNLIVGNRAAGMHIEQSNYPADSVLIDTNVVVGCGGAGIYLNGASGVTLVQNLFAGSRPYSFMRGAGIYVHLSDTFGGLSDSGRIAMRGNLILDNTVALDLNYPTALASARALDANLYGTSATARGFLINPYAAVPRIPDSVLYADVLRDLGTASPGLAAISIPYRAALTFQESRTFWGAHVAEHDIASRLDPVARVTRLSGAGVQLEISAALGSVTVPRNTRLTVDFTGRALPTGALQPGPWQGLPAGVNRLDCWKGMALDPFAVVVVPPPAPINTPPSMSTIADVGVNLGERAGPLQFTVSDTQTASGNLKVTATSSNTLVVPLSGITLGGSGAARSIAVTPGVGKIGQTTISMAVSDGVLTTTKSFVMTVGIATATDVDLAINFQPEGAPVPLNNLPDYGRTFANRGTGYSYGWSVDARSATRDRNATNSADQRHDTLINFPSGKKWEIAVPNGTYNVRLVCGDPSFTSGSYMFMVEGKTVINGSPTTAARWLDSTYAITVTDGRLTITQGATAQLGKLCFIEITSLPPLGSG